MKKNWWLVLLAAVVLAVLFVPVPGGIYKDGGTREFTALTYKVVAWNRLTPYGNYTATKSYWFPQNFKSIDELWKIEAPEPAPERPEYTQQWLDKETAKKQDDDIFDHIVITEIYSNCFFAVNAIPLPTQIKLNGTLSGDWCVGDQVICTYENTYYDMENNRIEADMLTIEASDWQPEPGVCYKPVVYLYPEQETEVSVQLSLKGKLTCTYPAYENGWRVTAAPDGMLTDESGQSYNYLYWEGETNARWDMTEGFCVKGADTAAFLEEALEKQGLSRKEANEFIVYWLPLMEKNPYNIISFQREAYTETAELKITPVPDTMIRVFMVWQGSDTFLQLPAQNLTAPERTGFTAVEWGGTELK